MMSQAQQDQLRQARESEQLSLLNPDYVRVAFKRSAGSKLELANRKSILVNKNTLIGNLYGLLKGKLKLKESEAVFLFAHTNSLRYDQVVGQVYQKYRDKMSNSTLVLEYAEYATFGS